MTAQFDSPGPATPWQSLTAATADLALVNSVGVAAGLAVRALTTQQSLVPVLTWLALTLLLHGANSLWLAGRTGQSVGDRIAQVATLSPATGRPLGALNLARISVRGVRPFVVARVSLAPPRDQGR
ncbi:MAG: hypothetical protein ACTHOK_20935 [Nocardioidaceae bacterium]